jgi:hypothetical protein
MIMDCPINCPIVPNELPKIVDREDIFIDRVQHEILLYVAMRQQHEVDLKRHCAQLQFLDCLSGIQAHKLSGVDSDLAVISVPGRLLGYVNTAINAFAVRAFSHFYSLGYSDGEIRLRLQLTNELLHKFECAHMAWCYDQQLKEDQEYAEN